MDWTQPLSRAMKEVEVFLLGGAGVIRFCDGITWNQEDGLSLMSAPQR